MSLDALIEGNENVLVKISSKVYRTIMFKAGCNHGNSLESFNALGGRLYTKGGKTYFYIDRMSRIEQEAGRNSVVVNQISLHEFRNAMENDGRKVLGYSHTHVDFIKPDEVLHEFSKAYKVLLKKKFSNLSEQEKSDAHNSLMLLPSKGDIEFLDKYSKGNKTPQVLVMMNEQGNMKAYLSKCHSFVSVFSG